MAVTRQPMLTPAPALLRRSRHPVLRPTPFRVARSAPQPVPLDDTESLVPQAVAGALFPSTPPATPPAEEDWSGVTLPPRRFLDRLHRRGHLGAPEKELLVATALGLVLAGAALLLDRPSAEAFSAADLGLAGSVLLSILGLLALGHSSRRPGPDDRP